MGDKTGEVTTSDKVCVSVCVAEKERVKKNEKHNSDKREQKGEKLMFGVVKVCFYLPTKPLKQLLSFLSIKEKIDGRESLTQRN